MSPINQDQSAYTTPVAPAAFPPLSLRNAPRLHPRRHPFEKKPSRLGLTQVSSSAPLVRSARLSSRNWAQNSPPATVTPLGPMGWAQPSPPAALTPAAGPDPSPESEPQQTLFSEDLDPLSGLTAPEAAEYDNNHVLDLSQHKIETLTPLAIIRTIGDFRGVVNHNTHGPLYMQALATDLDYAAALQEKAAEENSSLRKNVRAERRTNEKARQAL